MGSEAAGALAGCSFLLRLRLVGGATPGVAEAGGRGWARWWWGVRRPGRRGAPLRGSQVAVGGAGPGWARDGLAGPQPFPRCCDLSVTPRSVEGAMVEAGVLGEVALPLGRFAAMVVGRSTGGGGGGRFGAPWPGPVVLLVVLRAMRWQQRRAVAGSRGGGPGVAEKCS